MQPRVELRDYRFLDLHVRWVNGPNRPVVQKPHVIVSDGLVPEGSTERVAALDVALSPDPECGGYEITLSIKGLVALEVDPELVDEEKLRYLATLNGATILYGIVRAEIASLTSNFPGGRLVLPAVYMHEIIKQQADQAAAEAVRESIED